VVGFGFKTIDIGDVFPSVAGRNQATAFRILQDLGEQQESHDRRGEDALWNKT